MYTRKTEPLSIKHHTGAHEEPTDQQSSFLSRISYVRSPFLKTCQWYYLDDGLWCSNPTQKHTHRETILNFSQLGHIQLQMCAMWQTSVFLLLLPFDVRTSKQSWFLFMWKSFDVKGYHWCCK
jgi:hypothetical protein